MILEGLQCDECGVKSVDEPARKWRAVGAAHFSPAGMANYGGFVYARNWDTSFQSPRHFCSATCEIAAAQKEKP